MHPAQMEDLVRRLVADPNDQAALGAAYADGQHDPRGYATLLERVGEQTLDSTYAAHWLSEAAHVWSTTLGDARRAATLLMRAIEKDPASDVASDRLADLYRDKGDHRALVALYERRAKALAGIAHGNPELGQRLSILHEDLGRLWQEPPLSQPRKAIENFKKAFEIDPSAVSAIYAARELLKAQGDLKEALPLYELEIRAIDDYERKLALLRDEAAVRLQAGDAKGASQAVRTALRLTPEDSEERTALAYELATSIVSRVLAGEDVDETERAEAAALLVHMAETYDGEHGLAYSEAALDAQPGHDRAMQLAAYFAAQLGREEGIDARWAAYLKANPDGVLAFDGRKALAKLYEQQGRFDEAIEVLAPLKDDPDPAIATQLGELYAKTGKTSELAAHMDKHSAALPPAERVGKLLEIASMLAQKGDKKGALAKYKEVLEADPQHPEALVYVEDAHRAARNYRELRDVLLAAARVPGASIESRKAQLREVAALSEKQLQDPDGAIAAYRQLLTIDRSDESARSALHRLLEKAQRWDDLAAILEQEAMAAADPEQQIVLEKKLADLHEKKRGDKREAAEALLRVMIHAPKDEEVLARAVELLVAVDEIQRAASAIDDHVGQLDHGPLKGQLLVRLGELRDRLGDLGGAADAYAEAGEVLEEADPWRRAEEAAARAERWEQAAAAVGRRADLERDPVAQARLRAQEAEYLLRNGDPAAALQRLEQAIEIAPDDAELAERLERAYEEQGRLDDLGAFLVRRAEGAKDAAVSIALLKRAALFRRERLEDPDGARELLLRVVSSSDDVEALYLLADDAAARDDHQAALEYLERLAPLAKERDEKIKLGLRQASVLADGLGDVDAAVARYKRVLDELDDRCREALQAIVDLEEARGHYAQAADALERELELAQPGEEKAGIARRLGEIYLEHTRELGKSLAAYEAVVREDPEDFAALNKLRELCERAEKWPRVLELIDAQIEVEGDDEEIASLTARKAEILADHLERVDDALRTLAPLTASGVDVARATALAIADRHGADAQIGGQILAWARTTPGPEGQRLLGEAFDRFVRGGARDRALEIAMDVLRTPRGKDPAFLAQVESIAVETGATELVLEIHDRRGASLSGPARGEELVRQARVRVEIGLDRQEALEHGEIGLGAVPPSEAAALLDRLSELAPTPIAVVELYERHVARCKTPGDRLSALVRAYRRAIEVVSEGDQAVLDKSRELVELALGVAGADDPFEALWAAAADVDAAEKSDVHRRNLVDVIVHTTAGPRDGGRTRSSQLRRAAERMRNELGDDEAAFELLAQALVAHVDAKTLDAIEDAAGADARRAEALIGRALEEVFDGPLVRQLLGRRATIRKDKLGDVDGALRDLKKLHELAPADAQITERYRALLTEANDYRGLIQLFEDQILRSKDQTVRADLARQIARLWEERLGDAREAADAWRRVLRLKAQDPEATEGLDRAKRNKLKFEPGTFPPQRVVAETSIAPPPMPAPERAPVTFARPITKPPSMPPPVSMKAPRVPSMPVPAPTPAPAAAPASESTTEGFASEETITSTALQLDASEHVEDASEHVEEVDASEHVEELDASEHVEEVDTSVGPLGGGERTAEIPAYASAPDRVESFSPLGADDESLKTVVGDSQALLQAQGAPLGAATDEVPALNLPQSAVGADPDGSAEFIADDEVEELVEEVDDADLVDDAELEESQH